MWPAAEAHLTWFGRSATRAWAAVVAWSLEDLHGVVLTRNVAAVIEMWPASPDGSGREKPSNLVPRQDSTQVVVVQSWCWTGQPQRAVMHAEGGHWLHFWGAARAPETRPPGIKLKPTGRLLLRLSTFYFLPSAFCFLPSAFCLLLSDRSLHTRARTPRFPDSLL